GTPNAVNATLYERLNFDLIKDIAPIAGIIRLPFVMMVNPSSPAKTVREFIAHARANPIKVNFGSGGSGSTPHIAAELFRMMAEVDMVHVPYRGEAPALTDLLSGQLQVMFASMSSAVVHARAGTLRPLAVTTAMRSDALPDVPALGEFLPGYEASYRGGIGAPRNTPRGIIDKLNQELTSALTDPKIKARLEEVGGTPLVGWPADFGKLIEEETEKWAKVIRFAGIKPE